MNTKNIIRFISLLLLLTLFGCNTKVNKPPHSFKGSQSKVIVEMINAVNERNAEKYVARFAANVQIIVASEIKIDGRDALRSNRKQHFKTYPEVRSEIQYLVEIDNKVIMHDKVWLTASDGEGRDIVEIFTFEENKIIKVEVIQARDFFR